MKIEYDGNGIIYSIFKTPAPVIPELDWILKNSVQLNRNWIIIFKIQSSLNRTGFMVEKSGSGSGF